MLRIALLLILGVRISLRLLLLIGFFKLFTVFPILSVFIVFFSIFDVAQHFVGFVDFLEFLLSVFVVGIEFERVERRGDSGVGEGGGVLRGVSGL